MSSINHRTRERGGHAVALLTASALGFILTACAPTSRMPQITKEAEQAEAEKERDLVVDDMMDQYRRLLTVGYPILEKSAELCKANSRPSLEFFWVNKHALGKDFEGALSRHGFGNSVTIFAMANSSPLKQAGLKPGDSITAINGWTIPTGETAAREVGEKFNAAKQDKMVRLTVATKEGVHDVEVAMPVICAYDFVLIHDDTVNSAATGEQIIMTTGMMRFAQSDVELATVLGHETAHNLMGHIEKKKGNAAIGLIFDILFAGLGVNTNGAFSHWTGQAYSQEFEAEADYVGLYLMARAGYPVDGAANLWRRMGASHPDGVSAAEATTHPATPARFLALEKTAAEIDTKVKAGEPLVPNAEIPEKTNPAPANAHSPWS